MKSKIDVEMNLLRTRELKARLERNVYVPRSEIIFLEGQIYLMEWMLQPETKEKKG